MLTKFKKRCIIVLVEWYNGDDMNFSNDKPIYIQLLEQLEILIVSGKMNLGQRIPSVRDLSLKYKVNPNTVQKALQELENIGLIYTERTNGKFVTDNKKLIEKHKYFLASKYTSNYFKNMEDLGFVKEEALNYLKGDK